MNFEKKNSIYKAVMIIIVTALVTFLTTTVGMYNYYSRTTKNTQLDSKVKQIRAYLDELYFGEIKEEEKLIESAIKGYIDGLEDEYTEYLTKEEYEELMINVNGDYVGIGIYMVQDKSGNTIILLPIEDSPAAEAGLKTGDIITKINGEDCKEMDLSSVSNKVKGEEGTTVELEIQRDGELLNKTIERKTIELNHVKTEVLDNNIGYIQILSFDNECKIEFEEKLNELMKKEIKSLIIDVRDNGGGIVSEAVEISEMFVPKGKTIMIEVNKDGGENVIKSKKDAIVNSDVNIVVLANEHSASAAEILIGALKDNNIAKIVGTKTYGKGVMQGIVPVSFGGVLKLTIQEFHTPNGEAINKKGIEPDIKVEEEKYSDKDVQLNKAIEMCR
ncbi:MAG: S41 family peptidase [Clostridia bacterium]|nr:S41 family peptidase [Clostridia bacterium]